MREGHETRLVNEIVGVLGLARRELLMLAVATQRTMMDHAAVAVTRMLSTVAYAQQLAAQSPVCFRYFHEQFSALEQAAQSWIPDNLVLTDVLRAQSRVEPISADDTLLVGFDWDGLALLLMSVRNSTLSGISARRTSLDSLNASNARVVQSCFNDARLRLANFTMSRLEDCTLHRANLEGTRWRAAQVHRCSATDALLGSARLEHAQFVDCDFRNADIQGFSDHSNRGLVFVRCDLRRTNWHGRTLRGVSFVDCKLHGIYGAVEDLEHAAFERADVSPDGDQSAVVGKEEAILHWLQDFRAVMPALSGPSDPSSRGGRP